MPLLCAIIAAILDDKFKQKLKNTNKMNHNFTHYTPETTTAQAAQHKLQQLDTIICKPVIPRAKLKKLRKQICTAVKSIFDTYYQDGDHTHFQNYVMTKGIELAPRTFQRIIALSEDDNIAVNEKTSFIVLRHLFTFYEITPDEAENHLEKILTSYYSKK